MLRLIFLAALALTACESTSRQRGSLVGSPETMTGLAAAALECGYASVTLMPSSLGRSELEAVLIRAPDRSDPSACLNAWIESTGADVELIVQVRD